MGSSMVSSHFANRQSGKETIKKSSVLLENGETTILTPPQMMKKSRLEGNLALNTVPETNELPKKVKLANTNSNSSKLRPTIPCLANIHH